MSLHTHIIGTETEHDVVDPTGRTLRRPVVEAHKSRGRNFGVFNGDNLIGDNGCRAYPEVSEKAEYATPECRNGTDGAVYELAGSVYWALMAEHADHRAGRKPGFTQILRTNSSHGGASGGGNHINVSMPIGPGYDQMIANTVTLLRPFLSTIQLITGAGMVLPRSHPHQPRIRRRDYGYVISPRAFHVAMDFGTANTSASSVIGNKPLIEQRNESLADSSRYWRLQITGLDSNVLFDVLRFKLDLILLLAEMIVARKLKAPSLLDDPWGMHIAQAVSLDWRTKLTTSTGDLTSPLEVQWFYYHQAETYVVKHRDGRGQELIDEWKSFLVEFDTAEDVPVALFGRVDWVTKAILLELQETRLSEKWCYYEAERQHFGYHAFRFFGSKPCVPIQMLLRFGPPGIIERLFRALVEPPSDTRAAARGALAATRTTSAIGWSSAQTPGGNTIQLNDPAATTSPSFEAYMASLKAAERS